MPRSSPYRLFLAQQHERENKARLQGDPSTLLPFFDPVYAAMLAGGEREKRHISQTALGWKVGLPQSVISAYECGRRKMPLETLQKIAAALDLPVSHFFRVPTGALDAADG